MVARTGFEPVISALRGRCPGPLDERALFRYKTYLKFSQTEYKNISIFFNEFILEWEPFVNLNVLLNKKKKW